MMTNQSNWQQHIRTLLTKNGQFTLIDTSQKDQTTLEFYQQQFGDTETVIKVGYLDDERLITLNITNPKTPGHNAEQLDYFYENDFDQSKKVGFVRIGLPFNEVNLDAVDKIFRSGLNGIETKYFFNEKLQFSKVSKPLGDNQELYSMTHYFSGNNLWIRLFRKLVSPNRQYSIVEIDLRKIFSGVK